VLRVCRHTERAPGAALLDAVVVQESLLVWQLQCVGAVLTAGVGRQLTERSGCVSCLVALYIPPVITRPQLVATAAGVCTSVPAGNQSPLLGVATTLAPPQAAQCVFVHRAGASL
jgi:hypothetical protein